MTTRASFVSQIEAILQRTDLTTRIQTAINTVLTDICRKYDDWYILRDEDTSVTTVIGTYTYTLPTNTNRIYRIVYEDGASSVDLTEITPGEFDRKYPYPSSLGNGGPSEYCRRTATTIDLDKPCDAAKTLRIYRSKWATLLTGDSGEPEFTHIDDIIIYGVLGEIHTQLGIVDEGLVWTTKYLKALKEAYDKDIYEPHLTQTGVGWGSAIPPQGEYWANPFYKG